MGHNVTSGIKARFAVAAMDENPDWTDPSTSGSFAAVCLVSNGGYPNWRSRDRATEMGETNGSDPFTNASGQTVRFRPYPVFLEFASAGASHHVYAQH